MRMPTKKGRHVPQRTCIACRKTGDKRELVRLVRRSDGRVDVDLTGKEPGRGAYLCSRRSCWEVALRKDRVRHALGTRLDAYDRQKLLQFASGLGWSDQEAR